MMIEEICSMLIEEAQAVKSRAPFVQQAKRQNYKSKERMEKILTDGVSHIQALAIMLTEEFNGGKNETQKDNQT